MHSLAGGPLGSLGLDIDTEGHCANCTATGSWVSCQLCSASGGTPAPAAGMKPCEQQGGWFGSDGKGYGACAGQATTTTTTKPKPTGGTSTPKPPTSAAPPPPSPFPTGLVAGGVLLAALGGLVWYRRSRKGR